VLAVVAAAALAGCRGVGEPGGPGTPPASPTAGPTSTPTAEPPTMPTDPGGPTSPGESEGIEVAVEIEAAYPMPNLVETRLKQARADLTQRGATQVVVVDAREPGDGALAGVANGWTVCEQEPAGGELVRASATVVLGAAPNARACP